MATDRDLERRITRVENDTSAIYEILGEVQSTLRDHTRRFDGIDGRLDAMDRRFDGIDGRLDAMDRRFDGIDGRLDAMDRRFDGIDGGLDAMDRRFDAVGGRFAGIEGTLAEIVRRLPEPS